MTLGNGDMSTKPLHVDPDFPSPPSHRLTETEVQKTLANIHAVAKHLLHVPSQSETDGEQLYVGVQPTGRAWRVQVKYAGFLLEVKEATLDAALEGTLERLMASVTRQLEESTRILAALTHAAHPGTLPAVEETVRSVDLVQAVDIEEGAEPGLVTIRVVPTRVTTVEERDSMCFQLGAKLEHHRPAGGRFDLRVIGSVAAAESDE